MKLLKSFYIRDNVELVARELIGKILYCRNHEGTASGIIVETEAYHESEMACHAYGGKRTHRTKTLFKEGGIAYIYLCYGIHHLFNVVTGPEDSGQAVLIRAIQPLSNISLMEKRRSFQGKHIGNGPGKLSRALGIEMNLNEADLTSDRIWIEEGVEKKIDITKCTRIGVDYAGEHALIPWRFYMSGNEYVSK